MWKICHVYGLRSSRNPPNRQNSHYKYVWGQPRSLTSDALWNVKMQRQRLDVVISCPKPCVIFPFMSMTALYMVENMISLKNRPEAVHLMTPWLCEMSSLGQKKILKVLQKMPHELCKISARSARRFDSHFRKTLGESHQHFPHGRRWSIFSVSEFLKIIFH